MYKHASIIVLALILVSSFSLAAQPIEEVQTTTPAEVQALIVEPSSHMTSLYMREGRSWPAMSLTSMRMGPRTFLNSEG